MIKQFPIKIEETDLDAIKDYSEKIGSSVADVFKKGAALMISGGSKDSAAEIKALQERVLELTDENQSLKDTLEAAVEQESEISHVTITGREIKNHGFGKELNQAVDNVIYRLRKVRPGSDKHWARNLNQWSAGVIFDDGRPFTPASPSKEEVLAMEKATSKS